MSPPSLADELLGVITKVDADAKKITVIEKDKDEEIVVKTNDDTEYVTKDGSIKGKVVFEKLEKGIEKAKDNGGRESWPRSRTKRRSSRRSREP